MPSHYEHRPVEFELRPPPRRNNPAEPRANFHSVQKTPDGVSIVRPTMKSLKDQNTLEHEIMAGNIPITNRGLDAAIADYGADIHTMFQPWDTDARRAAYGIIYDYTIAKYLREGKVDPSEVRPHPEWGITAPHLYPYIPETMIHAIPNALVPHLRGRDGRPLGPPLPNYMRGPEPPYPLQSQALDLISKSQGPRLVDLPEVPAEQLRRYRQRHGMQ